MYDAGTRAFTRLNEPGSLDPWEGVTGNGPRLDAEWMSAAPDLSDAPDADGLGLDVRDADPSAAAASNAVDAVDDVAIASGSADTFRYTKTVCELERPTGRAEGRPATGH